MISGALVTLVAWIEDVAAWKLDGDDIEWRMVMGASCLVVNEVSRNGNRTEVRIPKHEEVKKASENKVEGREVKEGTE